jgi:hypothetical protein
MGRSNHWRDEPKRYRQLERFLLDASSEPPEVDLLRSSNLASYAYARLAPEHPMKAQLQTDLVLMTARHAAIRAELLPLIRAWRDAGIEVLIFKGFYLAEFVYEEPAQRHYGDVDILMRSEQALEASHIAQSLGCGWLESWHAERPSTIHGYRAPDWQQHEVMHLDNSKLHLRLDVHRRILHNKLFLTGLQERFTQEAWRASQELDWEGGTIVRVLQPVDSLLIGLILNRCWSSDDWQLKPHDLLDFMALKRKYSVTKAALVQRARELNCTRTLKLFLTRCDAFEQRFDLRPPSRAERQRWNLTIIPERGHPKFERSVSIALRVPGTLVDMARELPEVLHALVMLRQRGIQELGPYVNQPVRHTRALSYGEWRRIKRGVRRNLALLGFPLTPNSLPLTLALFLALRKRGCPVMFCNDSGSREGEQTRVWLELDGKVLEDGSGSQDAAE